jgi:glutathione S-transferase
VTAFAPREVPIPHPLADCAAIAHLPVVTMATKKIYGRDFFAGHPEVGAYLKEMGERPATRRAAEERKSQAKRLAERGSGR